MNTDRYKRITPEVAIEYDEHWAEVLELAEKYGFIRQGYGGVAILATHQNIDEIEVRQVQPSYEETIRWITMDSKQN